MKIKFMDLQLKLFDLEPLGFKLRVHASPPGIACAFIQKQYETHRPNAHCHPGPGDVVFDAGACWGETSLYFAHCVGPQGRVMAVEFIPSNLEIAKKNISLNPHLASRISILENPLWSSSKKSLFFVDWGPGSRVTEDKNKYRNVGTCSTITIYDIVKEQSIPRVDFIKMDIEGAEHASLLGAEQTIRKYLPKLAISVYHSVSDFITVPRFLDSLGLGYRFYLEHYTVYLNETVLFALPASGSSDRALPHRSAPPI